MKIKKNEILFFIAYSLMIISDILNYTYMGRLIGSGNVRTIVELFTYAFFIVNFFINLKIKQVNLVYLIGCSVVILVSAFFSKLYLFVKMLLCVISMVPIKAKKIIKYDMHFRSICMLIIICLSLIGLFPIYSSAMRDGKLRMILGFNHPNHLGLYFMIVLMEYLFLNYSKITVKKMLVLSAIIIALPIYTISRTIYFSVISILVLFVFAKINPKFLRCKSWVWLPIAILAINLWCIINYDSSSGFWNELNLLLSGRLYIANRYYEIFGITWFGQFFEYLGNKINWGTDYLDNAYMLLAISYGVFVLAMFVITYCKIIKSAIKREDAALLICIIVFLIYGTSELYMINIGFNFTLIYFSDYIYFGNKKSLYINNKSIAHVEDIS